MTPVGCFKPGIHLRQREAEARHSSLSSASVDSAMNRATCLRGCCNPSHWLLVDQSEAIPRNSPPYAQYGGNMVRITETKKHFLVRDMVRRGCHTVPRLASASSVFPGFTGGSCKRLHVYWLPIELRECMRENFILI